MVEKYRFKQTALVAKDGSIENFSQLLDRLRPMNDLDVPHVCELLNRYLEKFTLAPRFSQEEVSHWLLPRKDLMFSFVVEAKDKKDASVNPISAFVSFYSLPSHVLSNPFESVAGKIKELHCKDYVPGKSKPIKDNIQTAYLYYMAFESRLNAEAEIVALMKAVLTIAKGLGFDVFNCLNTAQNSEFLETLRFGPGDGNLRYYLYNWKTAPIQPQDVALVML